MLAAIFGPMVGRVVISSLARKAMPIATSMQQTSNIPPMYSCFLFMRTKLRTYCGKTLDYRLKIYKRQQALPAIFRKGLPYNM